jgi:hypothetical protein
VTPRDGSRAVDVDPELRKDIGVGDIVTKKGYERGPGQGVVEREQVTTQAVVAEVVPVVGRDHDKSLVEDTDRKGSELTQALEIPRIMYV